MKIHVTAPFGADDPISSALQARWLEQAGPIEFIGPSAFQIHGDLLTDIYADIRDDDTDPLHLITELDLIPFLSLRPQMAALLQNHAAVFAPYVTRSPAGALLEHPGLAAAWLIGFNMDLLRAQEPPLDWLGAAGAFNDAANGAARALEGRVNGSLIHWLDGEQIPDFIGLRYKGLGIHCFGQRHFSDPPASQLFFPGYTVGHHLAQIRTLLEAPGSPTTPL